MKMIKYFAPQRYLRARYESVVGHISHQPEKRQIFIGLMGKFVTVAEPLRPNEYV